MSGAETSPNMPSRVLPVNDTAIGEQPPMPRQCGRCRLFFAGDASLSPTAQAAWWLCPPCHIALLGTGGRGESRAAQHAPVATGGAGG